MSDLICAIATAPATAALGIIRVSGSGVCEALASLLYKINGAPAELQHGKATLCRIQADGEVYDEAVVTYYQAPRSYTGEDTIELCCHGGLYVLQSVCELLLQRAAAWRRRANFPSAHF